MYLILENLRLYFHTYLKKNILVKTKKISVHYKWNWIWWKIDRQRPAGLLLLKVYNFWLTRNSSNSWTTPPPLHLWVNVFQISTNNKSRVSQRNLRFGFRLQSEMKMHKWDSLTCQSMGYGTQMTVRACGPLVYYIYICILLTEKYSPRLIFIPFALIVREKFKIRWKQMLQTTSFEHKCVWVNSKMWQVKKGEKYSGWN